MSASNVRLQRAMNLSVSEGALATVMGTLLGGLFLTGFALELGASRLQIGIMAALPTLCNSAQFVGASILNRTGRSKRLCMFATWSSRLLWFPLLLVPMCLAHWSPESQAWAVIMLLALSGALGSIGGLAWLDWTKRLIPEEGRVTFLARRNLYNSGLSLGMSLAAAALISYWGQASTGGFIAVFGVAMLCGICGAYLLSLIPAADNLERDSGARPSLLTEPLRLVNYRRLLTGYSVWQFATQMAAPFYAVYMLTKLNVPFWAVTALATLGSLIALSLNGFWTRMKLRFGVRPVVLLATVGEALLPLCWLMVHPQTLWMIIPVHLFAVFNPPIAMGPNNLLLKIVPNRNSATYMALFNAATGAIGAVGAIFGGWLAMKLQGQWTIYDISLTGIQLVFLLSGIGKLFGLALLCRVHEHGASSVSELTCHLWSPAVRTASLFKLSGTAMSGTAASAAATLTAAKLTDGALSGGEVSIAVALSSTTSESSADRVAA